MKVIMLTRKEPRCIYCEAAKRLADMAGIDYIELPVEDNMELMAQLGLKTIPAIFKGDMTKENLIGGHAEFQRFVYQR